jgi:hypothetical protein
LDSILYGSPRIPSSGQCFVPGQQEHKPSGEEWKGFKQQAYEACQYLVFLYYRDKLNVSLVWCPTEDMIGDFMTKPLQGALFWKFKDQIMGVVPAQIQDQEKPKRRSMS